MYGAILGDMIGAPYEFDRGEKTKDFPLFVKETRFTDDTVMTIAVAEALMDSDGKSEDEIRTAVSLGGDCDTLTCIAGGMAEAFSQGMPSVYGVSEELKDECRRRLDEDILAVLDRFMEKIRREQF